MIARPGLKACLCAPCCLEGYEREISHFNEPSPCPDCGALLVMRYDEDPHLVIKCRGCGHLYERMESRREYGKPPRCPRCDELCATVREVDPEERIDIAIYNPVEVRPYHPPKLP